MNNETKPKIKKGDTAIVLVGRDRWKKGKIMKVMPKNGRVVIEGVNLRKKHVKPKKSGEKGSTVSVPSSLHISSIQLICPSCSKPTRVGFKGEGKNKVRTCKKCNNTLVQ